MVENDLHEVYGIDVDDEQLMQTRTWRWLRARLMGLQSTPSSRLWRSMQPPRR